MTEHVATPRRGRPRKIEAVAAEPIQAGEPVSVDGEGAARPVKRRRRASVGGHAMKLDAPVRPGFVRRFFNDDGNRLAEADALGYDMVSGPSSKSTDLGTSDSRLVGTKANGEPLRGYLMETPEELYAEGEAEREAHNRQIDEAIMAGVDSTGQLGPKSETYGQGSIERDR